MGANGGKGSGRGGREWFEVNIDPSMTRNEGGDVEKEFMLSI